MPARPRLPLTLVILTLVVSSLAVVRADLTAAGVYLNAADQLRREWRFWDALQLYAQAERIATDGPERVRAGVGVANAAVHLAEFDVAYSKATQVLREHPDDQQALDAYGQAAWANGLFDEAGTAFRRALARNGSDAMARLGMARVDGARSRLNDALDNALAAIAAAPGDAEAYSVAAGIYRRMRHLDEAIASLTKYYNLLPALELDRRMWTQGEIAFLRSFGRRVPGEIAAASLMSVHTIPIRLVSDKVIVATRVNGGESADFVLDTGAEQTVISESAARRLGIAPISRAISAGVGEIGLRGLQTAQIDTLQLGSLTIRNVPCLIKTPALEGLPVRESESFSPLALGLSAVIDYQRKQLLLARTLDAVPQGAEVPLWFSRLATVRGVINGNRPASFIVDTGGEVVSIGLDTARALSPQPAGRRIPLLVFGISGWDRDAFLMPGVSLAFDDLAVRDSSLVVMNLRAPSVLLGYRVGGTVGHHFLSKYRVTFDLQRSILGLSDSGR
jgi:tetratricopeptide (TPR) repeat protein